MLSLRALFVFFSEDSTTFSGAPLMRGALEGKMRGKQMPKLKLRGSRPGHMTAMSNCIRTHQSRTPSLSPRGPMFDWNCILVTSSSPLEKARLREMSRCYLASRHCQIRRKDTFSKPAVHSRHTNFSPPAWMYNSVKPTPSLFLPPPPRTRKDWQVFERVKKTCRASGDVTNPSNLIAQPIVYERKSQLLRRV